MHFDFKPHVTHLNIPVQVWHLQSLDSSVKPTAAAESRCDHDPVLLQATGLAESRESGALQHPTAAGIRMQLPDLSKMASLTALNLSDNRLTRVPPSLAKLTSLRFLDLSCNQDLQVRHHYAALQADTSILETGRQSEMVFTTTNFIFSGVLSENTGWWPSLDSQRLSLQAGRLAIWCTCPSILNIQQAIA